MLITYLGCEKKPADRTPGKVSSEDVRRDAGQAVDTTVEYSQQAKEEFQKKLETQLDELDAKIVKLREKGSDLKDDAKVKWERTMTDLEKKRETARAKLTDVGRASAEAWKDVQKGAAAAWDDLDKAFRDASK
jgi:TolA-binding protein